MKILSAGAVAPGLTKVIDMFQRQTCAEIKLAFATAPEIRRKLAADEYADVVIAPAALLDELVAAGGAGTLERLFTQLTGGAELERRAEDFGKTFRS